MEAFKHHIRLVVENELDADVIKKYYNTIKEHLEETVQPDEDNVSMVHHLLDEAHCYDISLAEDMDIEQGDIVAEALNKLIDENTDFLIEGTNSLEMEANLDDVNEEIGDNQGEIDGEIEGEESKIAFNSKYLLDVLSVLERGQIALETTSPSSPGVFRPIGSDNYIHVVMPMFVQW